MGSLSLSLSLSLSPCLWFLSCNRSAFMMLIIKFYIVLLLWWCKKRTSLRRRRRRRRGGEGRDLWLWSLLICASLCEFFCVFFFGFFVNSMWILFHHGRWSSSSSSKEWVWCVVATILQLNCFFLAGLELNSSLPDCLSPYLSVQ
jgi:ABC-type Fe3+ transport system permease subunit